MLFAGGDHHCLGRFYQINHRRTKETTVITSPLKHLVESERLPEKNV